jgi:hypothetical protein
MIEEDEEEKDVSEVNCVKSESTQSSLVIIARTPTAPLLPIARPKPQGTAAASTSPT